MIIDEVVLICILAMAEVVSSFGGNLPQKPPTYHERLDLCVEVGRTADELEVPVTVVVSIALEESSFTWPESKAGALGPLQIIPRYHCPGPDGVTKPSARKGQRSGCNLIEDGVKAVKWFYSTYDEDWKKALCHYNSGTSCYRESRQYASRVLKRHRNLERQVQSALVRMGDSGMDHWSNKKPKDKE